MAEDSHTTRISLEERLAGLGFVLRDSVSGEVRYIHEAGLRLRFTKDGFGEILKVGGQAIRVSDLLMTRVHTQESGNIVVFNKITGASTSLASPTDRKAVYLKLQPLEHSIKVYMFRAEIDEARLWFELRDVQSILALSCDNFARGGACNPRFLLGWWDRWAERVRELGGAPSHLRKAAGISKSSILDTTRCLSEHSASSFGLVVALLRLHEGVRTLEDKQKILALLATMLEYFGAGSFVFNILVPRVEGSGGRGHEQLQFQWQDARLEGVKELWDCNDLTSKVGRQFSLQDSVGVLELILMVTTSKELRWLYRQLVRGFARAIEKTVLQAPADTPWLIADPLVGANETRSRKRKDLDLAQAMALTSRRVRARGFDDVKQRGIVQGRLGGTADSTKDDSNAAMLLAYMGTALKKCSDSDAPYRDIICCVDASRVGGIDLLLGVCMEPRSGVAFWLPPQDFNTCILRILGTIPRISFFYNSQK